MSDDTQERRRASLTDHDVSRIKETFRESFKESFTDWCETIGYDVSTAETRSEIRDDHQFVRTVRKAALIIIVAFLGALGTGAAVAYFGGAG